MQSHDFEREFKPVDEIISSNHPTRGLDAFTLTYLRAERQIRKIFTHLVYQSNAFNFRDHNKLRDTIHGAKRLYFKNLEKGIRELSGISVEDMVGGEYKRLEERLNQAYEIRRKLFHGQLSDKYLSTRDLLNYEKDIREWCHLLAEGAHRDIGYSGIRKDSHYKAGCKPIVEQASRKLLDLEGYRKFLQNL